MLIKVKNKNDENINDNDKNKKNMRKSITRNNNNNTYAGTLSGASRLLLLLLLFCCFSASALPTWPPVKAPDSNFVNSRHGVGDPRPINRSKAPNYGGDLAEGTHPPVTDAEKEVLSEAHLQVQLWPTNHTGEVGVKVVVVDSDSDHANNHDHHTHRVKEEVQVVLPEHEGKLSIKAMHNVKRVVTAVVVTLFNDHDKKGGIVITVPNVDLTRVLVVDTLALSYYQPTPLELDMLRERDVFSILMKMQVQREEVLEDSKKQFDAAMDDVSKWYEQQHIEALKAMKEMYKAQIEKALKPLKDEIAALKVIVEANNTKTVGFSTTIDAHHKDVHTHATAARNEIEAMEKKLVTLEGAFKEQAKTVLDAILSDFGAGIKSNNGVLDGIKSELVSLEAENTKLGKAQQELSTQLLNKVKEATTGVGNSNRLITESVLNKLLTTGNEQGVEKKLDEAKGLCKAHLEVVKTVEPGEVLKKFKHYVGDPVPIQNKDLATLGIAHFPESLNARMEYTVENVRKVMLGFLGLEHFLAHPVYQQHNNHNVPHQPSKPLHTAVLLPPKTAAAAAAVRRSYSTENLPLVHSYSGTSASRVPAISVFNRRKRAATNIMINNNKDHHHVPAAATGYD